MHKLFLVLQNIWREKLYWWGGAGSLNGVPLLGVDVTTYIKLKKNETANVTIKQFKRDEIENQKYLVN